MPRTSRMTITTESGRTRELPEWLDPEIVRGLDAEGRIVVDNFDAMNPDKVAKTVTGYGGSTWVERPFLFGLTLCCDAYDKGVEDGVVCRGCYGYGEIGNYLFKTDEGTFPDLDPVRLTR